MQSHGDGSRSHQTQSPEDDATGARLLEQLRNHLRMTSGSAEGVTVEQFVDVRHDLREFFEKKLGFSLAKPNDPTTVEQYSNSIASIVRAQNGMIPEAELQAQVKAILPFEYFGHTFGLAYQKLQADGMIIVEDKQVSLASHSQSTPTPSGAGDDPTDENGSASAGLLNSNTQKPDAGIQNDAKIESQNDLGAGNNNTTQKPDADDDGEDDGEDDEEDDDEDAEPADRPPAQKPKKSDFDGGEDSEDDEDDEEPADPPPAPKPNKFSSRAGGKKSSGRNARSSTNGTKIKRSRSVKQSKKRKSIDRHSSTDHDSNDSDVDQDSEGSDDETRPKSQPGTESPSLKPDGNKHKRKRELSPKPDSDDEMMNPVPPANSSLVPPANPSPVPGGLPTESSQSDDGEADEVSQYDGRALWSLQDDIIQLMSLNDLDLGDHDIYTLSLASGTIKPPGEADPESRRVFLNMFKHAVRSAKELAAAFRMTGNNGINSIQDILLKGDLVQGSFATLSVKDRLAVLDAFVTEKQQYNMKANIYDSWFEELAQDWSEEANPFNASQDREDILTEKRDILIQKYARGAKEGRKNARSLKKQTQKMGHKGSSAAQVMKWWKAARSIRERANVTVVALVTRGVIRQIRRGKISDAHIISCAYILVRAFRQQYKLCEERAAGDFRGLAALPEELAGLKSIWSVYTGRWKTPTDALEFNRQHGAPSPGNVYLSSESVLEYGYLGHGDGKNASDHVMLVEQSVDGDMVWRAISISRWPKGTVFGICPHVMSCSEKPIFSGGHILRSFKGVNYDPTLVLGVLSFVEYSVAPDRINAKLASDLYCDSAIPGYYSLRVLVISTRPIAAFEPLVVGVESPSKADTLNNAIRSRSVALVPERKGDQNDFAHRLCDIGASLMAKLARNDSLDQNLVASLVSEAWAPFLCMNSSDYVPARENISKLLRVVASQYRNSWKTPSDLGWPHELAQSRIKSLAAAESTETTQQYHAAITCLNEYEFSVLALKCISLAPRAPGKTRTYPGFTSITQSARSKSQSTIPRRLACNIGEGHLVAAFYLLFCVETLRQKMTASREDVWNELDFIPHSIGGKLKNYEEEGSDEIFDIREAATEFLKHLTRLMSTMQTGSADSAVDRSTWLGVWESLEMIMGLCGCDYSFSEMRTAGDPFEIVILVHMLLEDLLRYPESIFAAQQVQGSDQASMTFRMQREERARLDKEHERPFLMGVTIGVTGSTQHRSVPAQCTRYLTLQLPYDAKDCSLIDLMSDSLDAERKDIRYTFLPEYIMAYIPRQKWNGEKVEKIQTPVILPDSLEVDLSNIAFDWSDVSEATEVETQMKYRIKVIVRHIGKIPDPGQPAVTTNYMVQIQQDDKWAFYAGDCSGPIAAGNTKFDSESIYMILLQRC